jgi:membrane-bound serine protease (ClpP class)
VVGSLVVFDLPEDFGIPRAPVAAVAAAVGAIALFLARLAYQAQRLPKATGREALVGLEGEAITDLALQGKILVRGEYYDARADAPLARGTRVAVVEASRPLLLVRGVPVPAPVPAAPGKGGA